MRPRLVLVGPYEFLADNHFKYTNGESPDAAAAKLALAAYKLLHVDAGWVSSRAAAWLASQAGGLPPGFTKVSGQPVVRSMNTAVGTVGVILFPEGPQPGKGPTPAQEKAVLDAAAKLRAKCPLIIGISPWGTVAEKAFLPKAQGLFTCLFGGGEGIAFAATILDSAPGVIWARPDAQGRAVNVIELYSLPGKDAAAWKAREGTNFASYLEYLTQSCPTLPAMQKLIPAK